jgi:hypothetical protein
MLKIDKTIPLRVAQLKERFMNKRIISYSYSLCGDELHIFITDENLDTYSLADITMEHEMSDYELDNLAQEIIFDCGYIIGE